MAIAVAVALHGVMLLPLVLWTPTVQPPDIVAAVELTPLAEIEAAGGTPDTPLAESAPVQPAPGSAPESAPEAAPAPEAPPPYRPPLPAETVVQRPPEPTEALASLEPPMADAADLVQGAPPPADAALVEAPPVPIPPAPVLPFPVTPPPVTAPVRPVPPAQPRPVRPAPPRPVERPAPRPTPARAVPPPVDTSTSMAATAPSAAPAAAAPAPAGLSPSASAPSSPRSSTAMATWSGELSALLQRAKRYPGSARDRGEQGVSTATFTMDRGGHVLSAAIVRSSGSRALDEEAVALIHRAEPLPPMPAEMPGSTITLTVPIAFSFH